jgi:deoxyribodipyrimidine photo-lyase
MVKQHKRVIVWMRRALRAQDNTPLRAAVQDADEVIPLFCLRDEPQYRENTVRRQFLRGLLRDCDTNLQRIGSRLFIRAGDPEDEIPAAAHAYGAEAVYAVRVYDMPTIQRDTRIASALKKVGSEFVTVKDSVLFEGPEILSRNGSPYKIFTPYRRAWLSRLSDVPPAFPHLRSVMSPKRASGALSLDRFAGFKGIDSGLGETRALRNLHAFVEGALLKYKEKRDFPGAEGTSHLSPYLANGAISIRTVFRTVRAVRETADRTARESIDVFLSELIWREFYYQILHHFPYVLFRAFRSELEGIAWSNDHTRFVAWRNGRTGYPIIDAAMQQLNTEGWMHNRARMIVASFLTKDLHINWQWGEKYFLERLIDADLACNNGGWQWAAGTGTDASPWFRIFNPVLQGEKFDPDGVYVRRYVPELAHIPERWIHKPWLLAAGKQRSFEFVPGKSYPQPIVDHNVARGIALQLYRTVGKRRSPTSIKAGEIS